MDDGIRQLKRLDIDDFIWLTYFFIVLFSLIANSFQRKYIFSKDKKYRNIGRGITLSLLIVAFFIYLYFVIDSIQDINLLKCNNNSNQRRVALERLITTLVFLVGGALSIYTEIDDKGGDVDLAIL